MSSIVTARGVSFELPNGRQLFSNLDLVLDSGVTALVGPNGVGKTCLAQILAGHIAPTAGRVCGSHLVRLLPQRQAPPHEPVDAFLGAEYTWSLHGQKLLEGIAGARLCDTLSGGQWMRVRLARALAEQFIILDEPTNDLDRDGREAVMNFLRSHKAGALLISHDRACLALCDDILELSNQGLCRFGGGWRVYEAAKQRQRHAQERALELAKRNRDQARADRVAQIARQEHRNRRGAADAARGGMPKILLGARKRQAQASTGKVDSTTMQRTDDAVRVAHEALAALKLEPSMYADIAGQELPAQKLVAQANSFNVWFGAWVYHRDLDFTLRGNARVVIKGANGSGKSTLMKAILGESFHSRGQLRCGELVSLCIDQSGSDLDNEKSVFENVRCVSTASDSEIRRALARFLFANDMAFQKVKNLSGGETVRAALARGFLRAQRPQLLVLDEPTNNLDLANMEFLEGLVRAFRGPLIVSSHDEVFLNNCNIDQELVLNNLV